MGGLDEGSESRRDITTDISTDITTDKGEDEDDLKRGMDADANG